MNTKKETDEKDAPERERGAKKPAAPPVQEYPKMLYHPDGRTMTVANKDEEAMWTKEGFLDTPQPAPEAAPKAAPKG